MGKAVKILNDYEIKSLALKENNIDYNNFYKEELIRMILTLKKELKDNEKIYSKIDELTKAVNYLLGKSDKE